MLNPAALFSTLQLSLQHALNQIPLATVVSSYTPFSSSFDTRVDELLKEWHTPGIAIGVIHENETWTKVSCGLYTTLLVSPIAIALGSQGYLFSRLLVFRFSGIHRCLHVPS